MFFTGRICRYCFYSRANFWVFRPAGAIRWTDPGQIWHGGADHKSAPPCQIWPWSVQGWGFTAPKNEKNWNFTNIIVPKGRLPCTIFTNFMRDHSLHNFAKFGCFISINDKIINNLFRRCRFQPNFRRPLAAELWMGAKKVFHLKRWHGPPLSPCKISKKSRDARRCKRMKCDVFHFFTGRICRRQLCRYCFYSRPIFGSFAPQGRHVAPIKVKFWLRSAHPCQISPWSVQGWGFTAPKTEKIGILPIKLPL